jgi:hypothetical protein
MRITSIVMLGLLTGCEYDEKLPQQDLKGKVRIPKAALTSLTLIDDEGYEFLKDGVIHLRDWSEEDSIEYLLDEAGNKVTLDIGVDMLGLLGPVYIGAFPSIEEGHYDFKHPEMGPILDADFPGDTYPYGGTTIGRFDYGCYEQLVCKVVTGRYTSFDEVLDFFRDTVQNPILGPDGEEVTSGITYQEECFEGQYLTSEEEISFMDSEPFETDDSLGDYFKPYFKDIDKNKNSDDDDFYEADVIIPHTFVEKGMAIWGWVDMPSEKFSFASCDESAGDYFYRYSEQFYTGTNFPNVLNYPGLYIDGGDWVVDEAAIVTDPDKDFVIELSYKYED